MTELERIPNVPQPGRDSRGRWLPGFAHSPGRLPRAREESIIDALKRAATPERMDAIAEMVVANAEQGQFKYVRFLFEYLWGRPVTRLESTISTQTESIWMFIDAARSTGVSGPGDE